MCKYIAPACFMANVFAVCDEKESINLKGLKSVRDDVSNKLADQNVLIEWTRDAVLGALEWYPHLFRKREWEIEWVGDRERKEVDQDFDDGFPQEFIGDLHRAIRESVEAKE